MDLTTNPVDHHYESDAPTEHHEHPYALHQPPHLPADHLYINLDFNDPEKFI